VRPRRRRAGLGVQLDRLHRGAAVPRASAVLRHTRRDAPAPGLPGRLLLPVWRRDGVSRRARTRAGPGLLQIHGSRRRVSCDRGGPVYDLRGGVRAGVLRHLPSAWSVRRAEVPEPRAAANDHALGTRPGTQMTVSPGITRAPASFLVRTIAA